MQRNNTNQNQDKCNCTPLVLETVETIHKINCSAMSAPSSPPNELDSVLDHDAPCDTHEDMDRCWVEPARKAIAHAVLEARKDELQRLNTGRHYGKDYQDSLDELDDYKEKRLAELAAQKEKQQ